MNRGKLTIIAILILAGGLTSFAVWFRHYAGRRSLEYWGSQAAVRIQESKNVRLFRLAPIEDAPDAGEVPDSGDVSESSGESISVLGDEYRIALEEDVSEKPGLQHLQRALIEDRTYVWNNEPLAEPQIEWDYILDFKDAEGVSRVAFELDGPWICNVSGGSQRSLDATKMAKFLRIFFTGE